MAQLGHIVEIALGLWFAALIGVIVVQLFTGRILSTGVLAVPHGPPVAASRLQLVLVTIAVGVGYAGAALAAVPGQALPDIPMGVLLALLGSNGAYLGRKYGAVQQAVGGRG